MRRRRVKLAKFASGQSAWQGEGRRSRGEILVNIYIEH